MNTLWVREYIRDLAEAAFPLDVAKAKLRSLQTKVTEHLFKVFYLPGSRDVPHWRGELSGWSVDLIRHNNVKTKSGKAYSDKLLEAVLWEEPFGTDGDLTILARAFELDPAAVIAEKAEFRKFVQTYIHSIKTLTKWR